MQRGGRAAEVTAGGNKGASADTNSLKKALWLPFLVCGAPALTALWIAGILWVILKSWR